MKEERMSNKHLVLAIFPDAPAAEGATATLKDTAVASNDALGILVLNDKGELDTDKVGARSWGAGYGSARACWCSDRLRWASA